MTTQTASEKNLFVKPRERLIDWVRKQLIGSPDPGEANNLGIVGVLPTERFPCGALYPISPAGEGIDPAGDEGGEADVVSGAGEAKEEPAVVRRYIPPSSLGFSFFIKGESIRFQVLCSAACYERTERDEKGQFIGNEWTRKQLVSETGDIEDFENVVCPLKKLRQSFQKLENKARVAVEQRRFADGWIVTISLCNANEVTNEVANEKKTAKDFVAERAGKTLFEASLRCVIDAGEVGAYPRVDRSLLDEEEQEIELQYAHRHVYAVGHGCAAQWKEKGGKVAEIFSDTMPVVEVPQMTADTGAEGEQALSLAWLSGIGDRHAALQAELAAFVDQYAHWVSGQEQRLSGLSEDDRAAAKRIVGRMRVAVSRMRGGLDLLSQDAQIRLAFSLANRAMLDQMRRQGKPRADNAYRWRPFQLAFLLTTLESSANSESEFRDMLDLIWFPTGGGKTEAYLGLIAFQIALRRLRHPDTGGGTTVLMRYTLRLLTRDQFVRATRLICALELIRRERDDLGAEPITIGMWVGEATSPNSFSKAAELVEKACATNDKPSLVLEHCPWCGDAFKADRNYDSTERHFHFLCRNAKCDFGASPNGRNADCDFGASPNAVLPCNVVDEALYAEPPTLLVATVDKFARLAWEERANAFFGGTQHLPPELIIQDELHLIAGALGSVAGLYEAALDAVVQSRGVYPKYIASTATIRMAGEQVKRLYGREVAVFPPPGLSCDDSWFARTVPLEQRPGRMYVGYLAPMLNRQACMAPLAAALLLARNTLFKGEQDERELLDAWWTQVVYHGSLKGVSNSRTTFDNAVRDFMRLLQPPSESDKGAISTTDSNLQAAEQNVESGSNKWKKPEIDQLTSLQTAKENAKVFARLTKAYDEEGCLDAVLATNMISVGLDVGRLGLMIINGQPLTTAEYIQASSRVGRGEVPGVVFANYYRDQARSLSHYESFRPYHDAFYRFVEPTSVTPYTYQACLRALHAALVIVIRHARQGLLTNGEAGSFDPDAIPIAKAIERLKRRCRQAVSGKPGEVDSRIDALVTEWKSEVERCRDSRRQLEYQVPDKDSGRDRLLYNHDDQMRGLWPTLQSLRHVENSVLLKAL